MYLRKCLLWTNVLFQWRPGSLGQSSLFHRHLMIPPQGAENRGCRPVSGPPVSTLGQCLSVASLFHHFFLPESPRLSGLLDCSHSSQHDALKMFQWFCISVRIKSRVLVMANEVPSALVPWHHLSSSPWLLPSILPSCLLEGTPGRPLRLGSVLFSLLRKI